MNKVSKVLRGNPGLPLFYVICGVIFVTVVQLDLKNRPQNIASSYYAAKDFVSARRQTTITSERAVTEEVAKAKPEFQQSLKPETKQFTATLSSSPFPTDFRLKGSRLTEGRWMELFPAIKKMAVAIEAREKFPTLAETTSGNHTIVTLNTWKYRTGGTLTAKIVARDYHNRPKAYGGDFFRAALYREQSVEGGGVSCEVADRGSGSYTVKCPTPWPGRAFLKVVLIHPSELLYLVMRTTNRASEPYVLKNTTFRNSKGVWEYGICDIFLQDQYKRSELCDHSNPRNGEPWFCVKPPSKECSPIKIQMEKVMDLKKLGIIGAATYSQRYNRRVTVRNSGLEIYVEDYKDQKTRAMVECPRTKIPVFMDPATPTGWFDGDKWISFQCKNIAFDPERFVSCCQNKVIYVLGDSTIYQWWKKLIGILQLTSSHSAFWSASRNARSERRNISIHYRAHGPPLHAAGPAAVRPYITDTLNSIKSGGKETHIIFTIGIHFGGYHPDAFSRRIGGIKRAILNLHSRLPDVRVYVIGLHSNKPWWFQLSQWIPYRHEVMLRHEFGNMAGVTFLPFWDMLSMMENLKVHLLPTPLSMCFGAFQPYICS